MRLWQHDETGRLCWKDQSPGERWDEVSVCYEDELPASISDSEYNDWFAASAVVDGVRVGPRPTLSMA